MLRDDTQIESKFVCVFQGSDDNQNRLRIRVRLKKKLF